MRESSCLISRKCDAIESSALGMLGFLQRWAYDHDIRLKLFNPTKSVQDRLEHAGSVPELVIATLDEMMALLARADSRHALAARSSRLRRLDQRRLLRHGSVYV